MYFVHVLCWKIKLLLLLHSVVIKLISTWCLLLSRNCRVFEKKIDETVLPCVWLKTTCGYILVYKSFTEPMLINILEAIWGHYASMFFFFFFGGFGGGGGGGGVQISIQASCIGISTVCTIVHFLFLPAQFDVQKKLHGQNRDYPDEYTVNNCQCHACCVLYSPLLVMFMTASSILVHNFVIHAASLHTDTFDCCEQCYSARTFFSL